MPGSRPTRQNGLVFDRMAASITLDCSWILTLYSVSVICKFWTTVFRGIGSPIWSVVTYTSSPERFAKERTQHARRLPIKQSTCLGSETTTRHQVTCRNNASRQALVTELVFSIQNAFCTDDWQLDRIHRLQADNFLRSPDILVSASSKIETLPANRSISPNRASCALSVAVCVSSLQEIIFG